MEWGRGRRRWVTTIAVGAMGLLTTLSTTGAEDAAAPTFDAVEFISYRTDLEGQIPCGPRAAPQAVYLTWSPSSTAGDGIIGTAVAIEFLPDGFVPADSERPVP